MTSTRFLSLPLGFCVSALAGALAFFAPVDLRAETPTAPTDGGSEGSTAGSFPTGTVQVLYVASELKGIRVGDTITGLSFRLDSSVSSFSGTGFAAFDIKIGPGGSTLGTTFADNFSTSPTTVRSGSLAFAGVDFETGEAPNAFGKAIPFDSPFVYTGGNLVIEFRTSEVSNPFSVDGFNDTDSIAGKAVSNLGSSSATTANIPLSTFNHALAFHITPAGSPTTDIEVPNGAVGEGSGDYNLKSISGGTVQNLIREADLNGLKSGDEITGFCLRLNGAHNGTHSLLFPRFDVKIGPAAPAFTGTYAERFGDGAETVRMGPMAAFLPSSSSSPNGFGGLVRFDSPYSYTGGDLLLEIRFAEPVTPGAIAVRVDMLTDADGVTGELASTAHSDSTSPSASASANWAMQLKVLPAPPPGNEALKASLRARIAKLNRQAKKARRRGQIAKSKRLKKKIRRLRKRLRRLG